MRPAAPGPWSHRGGPPARGVGVILGSAFDALEDLALRSVHMNTPFGPATLWTVDEHEAWVLFRHGQPHTYLPHQINWRANIWALAEAGVGSLLVTSSVGVMDPKVPLFVPLLVRDLIMLDNRLPDGSPCTMFLEPTVGQGHLVLEEGLFSPAVARSLRFAAGSAGQGLADEEVVFLYRNGPRTKTAAENRMLAGLGGQVNSMSVAPEVVLASELGMSCAAVVVGHKHSQADEMTPDADGIAESLERSRAAVEALVRAYLSSGTPVPSGNHLYRFDRGG